MASSLGTAVLISLCQSTTASPPMMIVDTRDGVSMSTEIAIRTCSGLFNRDPDLSGAAFVYGDKRDGEWLHDAEGIDDPTFIPVQGFLAKCLAPGGPAKGYIMYNATLQQLIVPNVITLAGVLDAVPLEDGDVSIGDAPMIFDALEEFAGFDAHAATEYVYERYVNSTSTMAKMDPGLTNKQADPFHPQLTGKPRLALTDYIVKEKLFNFYLYYGCIPHTKEHALMERMVRNNPWPKPIAVYGYDHAFYTLWSYTFEAETFCVRERNMGQIASDGVTNLAFFSRKQRINVPLRQNDEPSPGPYNSSKNYITLIVGDGDNVDFVKGTRRDWMTERVARCAKESSKAACFPLVWTLSPQLLHLAPDWMQWYYNMSYATGRDYFILPPSGDLYSYPRMMKGEVQDHFVSNTEQDCILMNTSGSIAWEWVGSWKHAIENEFPKYSENGIVRGLFSVQDPFIFPQLPFGPQEYFKVLGAKQNVVLFKQREWRGKGASDIPFSKRSYRSAKDMAAEINGYARGTVTAMYTTSDGGLDLALIYEMVQQLGEHVEIVNQNLAVEMAMQSHAKRGAVQV